MRMRRDLPDHDYIETWEDTQNQEANKRKARMLGIEGELE